MNREIKFRAWDKLGHPEKEICEVLEIDFKEQKVLLKGKNKQEFWRLFKDVELLQFTGLKDKNGKDIYEGNIVNDILNHHIIIIAWLEIGAGFFYNKPNEENGWSKLRSDSDFGKDCKWREVIGNIYENPELLEVGK